MKTRIPTGYFSSEPKHKIRKWRNHMKKCAADVRQREALILGLAKAGDTDPELKLAALRILLRKDRAHRRPPKPTKIDKT